MRIGLRSIRAKFVAGFFVIFAVSFLLLSWTVTNIIQSSNQKIITDDLSGLKKTGSNYVRQAFMINHFASDDIYFGQIAEEIIGDLRYATSSEVGAYTVEGELIHASDDSAFSGATSDDLKQASRGATAYTLSYAGGTASVYYSYPVVIDGVKVGILRYAKPFDLLYEQSDRILNAVFYIALAIFAAAFLFSYLLSRHIAVPLSKLESASTEVMKGNLDVRIEIRQRDEIGRLADNFNDMILKLGRQIGKIERDRDRLEKLHLQGKHFFDNVTHELKTPLTSILGYAELIRENGESDPAFFRKGMNHIVGESQRLHGMVVSLLETSKEQRSWEDSGRIEAGGLLRDVCDAMSFKAQRYKKNIRCETDAGLYVEAQPDMLRQLLINLIDNAIKYSDPGAEITAAATGHSDLGLVRMIVANPGSPIPAGKQPGLFEPFGVAERSAREQGSVGLGLSIAKSIIDELGGTIRIASEEGVTSVTLELPVMKGGGA